MPAENNNKSDYQPLGVSVKKGAAISHDQATLKPSGIGIKEGLSTGNFVSPKQKSEKAVQSEPISEAIKSVPAELVVPPVNGSRQTKEIPYAEQSKRKKKETKTEKDRVLLDNEKWFTHAGHNLTYLGLYQFCSFLSNKVRSIAPSLRNGLSINTR